ncbi:MAG TPA: decaprenyl-phosphate phosphoribosyltransferase [Streptosporangiaceae bacterium]|nr:decaprenyl-phosphate phosphoribosyltransferase [Streptosporangiaceae bacterium]
MTAQASTAKASARSADGKAGVSKRVIAVVRTARPRQWPKNLLVFAAPLAGATLGRANGFFYALAAMFAFTCASAAVYFVNDVADVERDRQHPVKRNRPIASGDLAESPALLIAGVLVIVALIAGFAISAPLLSAALAGYMSISFLYSALLKHIPFVEVAFVASGFLLRVLGGAAATHIRVSGWFLLVCSLGALGVAVAKRYTELVTLGPAAIRHRPVMKSYHPERLRVAQYAIGAATLVCYLLWAAGEHSHARIWHLVSAIPLAAALIRFGVLTGRGTTRPVEDLISRDGVMLACEIGWLSLFAAGLYVA